MAVVTDQPPRRRRDPAPSRLAYRLERMWLKPLWRRLVRLGLPAFLLAMTVGLWLSDDGRRVALTQGATALVDQVRNRDEFMVRMMTIDGASPPVDKALRAMLPVDLPASSFDIDLTALRLQVMALDAVETVELRIRPGGILSAAVTERQPALLWRHARGIDILDKGGHRVASITAREMRSDLPMIAGEGADLFAAEALALFDAAGPILPRVRGIVRIGQRRWDMVLDRGQRILLPEDGAPLAFQRLLADVDAQDLLNRDVSVVDLRDPERSVVRLGIDAQNRLRAARAMPLLAPDGTILPADQQPENDSTRKEG